MLANRLNYTLPKNLIAQEPKKTRDRSRLLVFNRQKKSIIDDHFYNLGRYLRKGDVVVLNNSKVIPARLIGRKDGVGRKIEVFLVKKIDNLSWDCLIGGKKRENIDLVFFDKSKLKAKIIKKNNNGTRKIKFNLKGNQFWQEVMKIGEVPTPPYIKKHKKFIDVNKDFYQTIFAEKKGSVAAPTAGFHFTEKLVKDLKGRGVKFVFITLHVGPGTFAPVKEKKVEKHQMQAEWFELDLKTAKLLNKAKRNGRRIIAVGTTATRVLENCATTPLPRCKKFLLIPFSGETKKFIYPGYKFKFVDVLITNFHLPYSTPLLLASAFIENGKGIKKNKGIKILLEIYKEAIKKKYRFYSFGDAMLIV